MARISSYLQKILDAVYGEEVRGSIHDALSAMNEEASSAMEYAATAQDSARASASSAEASASAAAQTAADAANSAEQAAASEENAGNSEQNAADKAAIAAGSAAAAALSEQNADHSATLAAQKAQEAENSKSAAAQSAADASERADDASASALSAKQYSGKPPKPDSTTKTWWIWDAEAGDYVDSHIGSEIEGPQGVGIVDITLTSGDHTPGTTDIYTVELTDGRSRTISVWNGRNGEGAGDVLGISFDLVIPAAGWSEGQITIADERLIALATCKYFVAADEASREEYLNCRIRPGDVTATGFITFTNDTDPSSDLTVNVIRFELSANR